MTPCELTFAITALANAIAEGMPEEELLLIASAFGQLGDTLEVIAAQRIICERRQQS